MLAENRPGMQRRGTCVCIDIGSVAASIQQRTHRDERLSSTGIREQCGDALTHHPRSSVSLTLASDRVAETSTPIHPVLAERFSPRAFDTSEPIDETKLTAALEAARWSPSAANTQPWRFIVARRGTAQFDTIVANLLGFNQYWALNAGALIVGLTRRVDGEGKPMRWAQYDLGQSLAHLSVQAHHDGLHVHQMGGVLGDELRAAFGVGDEYEVLSVTAIGVLGDIEDLPENTRERELAPRTRLPLGELLIVNA
jgi:nitroreductase